MRFPGDGTEAATLRRAPRTITGVLVTLAFVWAALSTPPVARATTRAAAHHHTGPRKALAPPPNSLPGIDVSHHQDAIDWTKVAGSGVRFAIAKATEGTGFIDPLFSTNRADAMAAGITFGAYHFARPDLHPFNPVPEADHFVDTAQLAPGNILPVLDLERSGDLSPAELTDWVLEWLGRVTERTGVRPMVYTSPNGWKDRMADTTAIADAGYTVLWVAHWGVAAPTLPANDWQGNGWTIWQHSNCGNVPGINGCVDLDWFDGLDFAPILIPSARHRGSDRHDRHPHRRGRTRHGLVQRDRPRRLRREPFAAARSSGVPVDATITCASKAGEQVNCATGKRGRRRAGAGRAARSRAELPGGREPGRNRQPDRRSRREPGRAPTKADFAAPTAGGTGERRDPLRLAPTRRPRTRSVART